MSNNRLFITTGLISLINALSVIQERNIQDCEDTLIIVSFNQSEDFIQKQTMIAGLHNFSKIIFYKKEKELLQNIDWENYDEIYCITFYKLAKTLQKLKCCYIFDEGPGYAIFDTRKMANLKGFYITNFLNKFSFINAPENVPNTYILPETFNNVASKVRQLFNDSPRLESNRNLLFIGHYIYRQLGDEFAENFYKKWIDYFISLGYTVYFKAHPRDNDIILPKLETLYA